jgi:hypothetical protein
MLFAIRPFINAVAGPYAGYTGLGGITIWCWSYFLNL